jgi:uncharacterized membrane protein YjjP (DUF1212 family)
MRHFELLNATITVGSLCFAAVCAWLTVRIINRRERWAIVLAVVAVIVGGILAAVVEHLGRYGYLGCDF